MLSTHLHERELHRRRKLHRVGSAAKREQEVPTVLAHLVATVREQAVAQDGARAALELQLQRSACVAGAAGRHICSASIASSGSVTRRWFT